MLVSGMQGLGDNVYQRAVLREVKERVYLRTSWPQMYQDIPNIKPIIPKTRLRTQLKNINRVDPRVWVASPCLPLVKISYTVNTMKTESILDTMQRMIGVKAKVFDLPKFKGPDIPRPYAIVRPTTLRAEWRNHARGAKPEYIVKAAEQLKKAGYYTVSVADLEPGFEWADDLPNCDLCYNGGELDFESLFGLVQGASVVVGGVGWIVPAAIAAGVPFIGILGGLGAFNAPEKICSGPMNLDKVRWLTPDKFCLCDDMRHGCNKTITDFRFKFNDALEELCLSKLPAIV